MRYVEVVVVVVVVVIVVLFHDEIVCKTAWAIRVSQSRVTGLAISRPGMTETGSV